MERIQWVQNQSKHKSRISKISALHRVQKRSGDTNRISTTLMGEFRQISSILLGICQGCGSYHPK